MIAQPIVDLDDRVDISIRRSVGAATPTSPRRWRKSTVRELWRNTRMKNRFASVVFHKVHHGFDETISPHRRRHRRPQMEGRPRRDGEVLLAASISSRSAKRAIARCSRDAGAPRRAARFPAISGKTCNDPVLADGILLRETRARRRGSTSGGSNAALTARAAAARVRTLTPLRPARCRRTGSLRPRAGVLTLCRVGPWFGWLRRRGPAVSTAPLPTRRVHGIVSRHSLVRPKGGHRANPFRSARP